eukprot:scaffold3.g6384.t1
MAAQFQGCQESLPGPPIRIVGMGGVGVDYLAAVASFPRPDDKLRTEALEVQGGGNCGNALTASARLGLAPVVVSKIGGDSLGDGIVAELRREGVDTGGLLRAAGAPSPFTYIIVDRQGGTRTCIHTPSEPMRPEELTPDLADRALAGASLAYFDGRLTEAALVLARAARAAGVPVLVEAERLRPGLEELLALADYVVTSAHFPEQWTGEACLGDALLGVAARLPAARWVVTTLGARGSVLLEPAREDGAASSPGAREAVLDDLVAQLLQQAAASADAEVGCVSASGVEIRPGGQATTGVPVQLRLRRGGSAPPPAVQEAQQAAAAAAAAANADGGNAARYAMAPGAIVTPAPPALAATVTVTQAARLPPAAVLDTTGAGDSFIGSLMYGIASSKPLAETLRLASVVAACKCTALGARPGLPRRANLQPDLL